MVMQVAGSGCFPCGWPAPGVGQGRTASPAGRVRAAEATEQRLTFRLPLTSDEDGFLEPVPADLGHARCADGLISALLMLVNVDFDVALDVDFDVGLSDTRRCAA